MQIIAKRTLRLFWEEHPQAETSLKTWFAVAHRSKWATPADVKADFGENVDFLADNRAIFDIAGNKYRLIVHIAYKSHRILIKFVGTHAQYDKVNAETIQ